MLHTKEVRHENRAKNECKIYLNWKKYNLLTNVTIGFEGIAVYVLRQDISSGAYVDRKFFSFTFS